MYFYNIISYILFVRFLPTKARCEWVSDITSLKKPKYFVNCIVNRQLKYNNESDLFQVSSILNFLILFE